VPGPPPQLERGYRLVTIEDPGGEEAHAFTAAAAKVLRVAARTHASALLVAGSVAEDGAPTVAANLAVEAARLGRRVVLVDLDAERPTMRRRFALGRHAGRSEVVSGEHDLDSAPDHVHTGHGVLEVLTAGSSPRPIDGRRFARVLPSLRARAHLALLLSPPLLEEKRARELARQCDGIVLASV
jgi:non-specific protein-tyrosine kinase